MAVDKLVDSTQLDADLTSVANAIRAKSGGSSQLAFPSGFVSEIGNIPSGGQSPVYGVYNIYIQGNAGQGTVVEGVFPDLTTLNLFAESAGTITRVDLTSQKTVTIISSCSVQYNGGALKEIDLHGGKAIIGPSSSYGLRYRVNLETVNAKCVVATTNTNNQFTGSSKLKTIYFQENAQTISVTISACPLDNASLVSLANGLSDSPTSSTLTLSSTRKATATTLMGTVSQVTDGDSTYDFFTADPNGTVTLAEFITNTKGWTLA